MVVNDRSILHIVIDSHYQEKHADSITDEIILALVAQLNGRTFDPDDNDEEFEYFKTDPIKYAGKNYRLI